MRPRECNEVEGKVTKYKDPRFHPLPRARARVGLRTLGSFAALAAAVAVSATSHRESRNGAQTGRASVAKFYHSQQKPY